MTKPTGIDDCLARADVDVSVLDDCDTCVATLASAGYEWLLDALLGSLADHGGLCDARVVVFVLGDAGPRRGRRHPARRAGHPLLAAEHLDWRARPSSTRPRCMPRLVATFLDADMSSSAT